jgi:hypothetical protein
MVVFYLCMKGMPLDAIHDDLVRTLGREEMVYSMVIEHTRSANFLPKKNVRAPGPTAVKSNSVDDLSERIFLNMRSRL